MKTNQASLILLLVVATALTTAEPPRRRSRPAWAAPQRQVAAEEPPAEEPAAAPYPPSGWRPSKAFNLPGEYGAPNPEYGTPEEATTTEAAETTTAAAEEEGTTTQATPTEEDYDAEPEAAPANIPAPGVYYVLLPDGRIQRIAYQAVVPAPPAGRYVIEDVQPDAAPFYAYSAPSLIRLLKK